MWQLRQHILHFQSQCKCLGVVDIGTNPHLFTRPTDLDCVECYGFPLAAFTQWADLPYSWIVQHIMYTE